MDSSPKRHLAVVGLHVDAPGIRLGGANERLFDLRFELTGRHGRDDPDLIADALDADQKTHRLVGCLTLELVGNLAGEREQAMVGRDREALVGYRYVPAEGVFGCPGEVRIRSLVSGNAFQSDERCLRSAWPDSSLSAACVPRGGQDDERVRTSRQQGCPPKFGNDGRLDGD